MRVIDGSNSYQPCFNIWHLSEIQHKISLRMVSLKSFRKTNVQYKIFKSGNVLHIRHLWGPWEYIYKKRRWLHGHRFEFQIVVSFTLKNCSKEPCYAPYFAENSAFCKNLWFQLCHSKSKFQWSSSILLKIWRITEVYIKNVAYASIFALQTYGPYPFFSP